MARWCYGSLRRAVPLCLGECILRSFTPSMILIVVLAVIAFVLHIDLVSCAQQGLFSCLLCIVDTDTKTRTLGMNKSMNNESIARSTSTFPKSSIRQGRRKPTIHASLFLQSANLVIARSASMLPLQHHHCPNLIFRRSAPRLEAPD